MNKRSDTLTVTDIIRDRALNCTREFIFPRPNGRKSCSGRFSLAQLIIVVLGSQSYSQIFRNDTQIVFFYGVLPYSGDKAEKNKVILSYFRQCPVINRGCPHKCPSGGLLPMPDDHPTVYSTKHGQCYPQCGHPIAECICKKPPHPRGDGIARVRRESKERKGKTVTLVTGAP